MVTVALAQLELAPRPEGELTRPLSLGTDAVAAAAEQGAQFVVLPELWPTGPFELETTLAAAQALNGEFAETMAHAARANSLWVHAGSFLERATDGRLFNTSLLFDDQGDLVATYRKRYLFGFDQGEAALIDAGDEVVVVDTPLGPTGLATCYDLRFGEHFRELIDAGAQTAVIASGWPVRRISHWDVLAAARAIDNQMWIVATNSAGISRDVPLGGHSCVVDPWGVVVAADDQPGLLLTEVDPAMPTRTRSEFPILRDRR